MKENVSSAFASRTSLRQLRALGAVCRTGSVSEAAHALGVTPPAVTQQLRLLEQALGGLPLTERAGAVTRATQAGAEALVALGRIESALADCAAAIESLSGQQGRLGGRLAVGVISTAKYFAPFALAAFQRQFPAVEIRVLVGNRQATFDALEAFEVDVAIMGRPPEHIPVEQAVIGDNPHVIVAPPEHRLAKRRRIALDEIARETFLLREPGSGTRDLLGRLFDNHGFTLGPRTEIGSNETIKQAVMAGMGVALLSLHTLAAEVRDGRLKILDVVGLPVVRQWFVVRHRDKRLLPAGQALWEHLCRAGAEYLPRPG
jgi:DNA-binding transcriptional LysR family regulator